MSDRLLPLLSSGALRVRAAAFGILLETGQPVEPARLSERAGVAADRLQETLTEQEECGSLRRDEAGRVVVCGGLSVAPTPHQIILQGVRRFTCCAYDALGIVGALGADGDVESTSPETGPSIRVRFTHGSPEAAEGVLFFADSSSCVSTLEDWCPNVNLFEDRDSAIRWSHRSGIAGRVMGIEEAAKMGAREWKRLLEADPARGSDREDVM